MKTNYRHQNLRAQELRRADRKERAAFKATSALKAVFALKTESTEPECVQFSVFTQSGMVNSWRVRSFARHHEGVSLDLMSSRYWLG
ncbi:MAG: hypothetical protein ROM54_12605 [Anaerobiospirillum sp.]|nr:hypothetical protein [Anaerobiospirillum sp.]